MIEHMQDRDTWNLKGKLPRNLLNRSIPDIITTSNEPVYIYGAPFEGKSTLGKLIAINCSLYNIPFLYVEMHEFDTCQDLATKFGYYSNTLYAKFILHLKQMFRFGKEECRQDFFLANLKRAGESFVQG